MTVYDPDGLPSLKILPSHTFFCDHAQIEYAEEQLECRRVLLLRHFEEPFDPAHCHGTCDNCQRRGQGQYEQQVGRG